MASKEAAKAVASGVVDISKKYTLQSTGVWEVLRRFLSIDPNRSNGVPLNPLNRLPSPGSIDPKSYRDPVTYPAGDIAGNPYWKRDHRRAYPRRSVFTQGDVVGLLAAGEVKRAVTDGKEITVADMQIVEKEKGKSGGVAGWLVEGKRVEGAVEGFFVGGLPPTPSGMRLEGEAWGTYKYKIGESSYPDRYQVRSFQ